jgi:hypothetical protein
MLKIFRRVSNLSKHQMGGIYQSEPTEILTFLGIEFDTLAMELRLPNEKLVELKHTLELFVQSKKVTLSKHRTLIYIRIKCQRHRII